MNSRVVCALGAALFLSLTVLAQDPQKSLNCDHKGDSKRIRFCEMRESSVPVTGRLAVDASPNGGVSIKGWSKNEILVRAKVESWGDTDAEAKTRAAEVRVLTDGNKVRGEGPKQEGRQQWSVSYEVFLPAKTDLNLNTVNGGIHVNDVYGDLAFQTVNGGLHLARIGGKVKGETVNGGVHAELSAAAAGIESVELQTVNGGLHVNVPAGLSAHLVASTNNGGLHSNLPGASVTGSWGNKKLDATIGAGGPLIKLATVNGGIHIK